MASTSNIQEQDKDRIVAMAGCLNFRDLGGYPTVDGRRVARGRLFRSASMDLMTSEDRALLGSWGIRYVHDLRSNGERAARPMDFLETLGITYVTRDYAGSRGNLVRAAEQARHSRQNLRESMVEIYRRLPYEQAPAYARLFRSLAAGEVPLVFNCAAGKDRTGVAAALILTALDVDRSNVRQDYMLTEHFLDALCETVLARLETRAFEAIDRDVWLPMLRSDPAYLDTMFETIERNDGSIPAYFEKVLGLSSGVLEDMRRHLLAPANEADPQ